jgi:hypothetical protein
MDDSPALEWLTSKLALFPEGFKRNFAVSAVNVANGEFETFTQDDITIEEAPAAALSSSSIPGWFQPRPFKGMLLMDGGTVYNTDATNGVLGCLNAGYAEEDIIMDIAICGDDTTTTKDKVSKNALFNFMRAVSLYSSATDSNSIAQTMAAYPAVNYRHLFLEQDPLVISIDFRNSTTWPLQEQGR